MATKSSDGNMALIAYNYDGTDDKKSKSDEITIDLKGLSAKRNIKVSVTILDKNNDNTYREWERSGIP